MPIIEFNKKNIKLRLFLASIAVIFAVGAFFSISIYNETVELKHQFSEMEEELHKREVLNAELKNKLYSLMDVGNMRGLVSEKGLILDKSPEYLEFSIEELAKNLYQPPGQ